MSLFLQKLATLVVAGVMNREPLLYSMYPLTPVCLIVNLSPAPKEA